jgi:catechol 2,3-dioxygenase-like lactoylglutathione lyase family enzyme
MISALGRPAGWAAALLVAVWVTAVPGGAEAGDQSVREGFKEVVLSVTDLEAVSRLFQEVAGWEIIHRGLAGPDQAAFWELDADQEIHEIVLANPGAERGFLRLVEFPGARQRQIRSSAQTWDTGGHFDFNVRVKDIHRKFDQLRERGWQFYSDPIQFHFGPFTVWEVLAKGPDGLVIAMVERVQPPLEGWPNLRELSRIFNATQIVRDFDRSREFFEQQLGFKVYLEHVGPSKEPGPTVLGLPHNLATEVTRKVVILSPDGSNEGSVELLAFEGITGADFSPNASPPNLGILTLRFPVADLDSYTAEIGARGVTPIVGPADVTIAPYGPVTIMAVRAPEGALIEFYQLPDAEEE